jgi:hypothetical protein
MAATFFTGDEPFAQSGASGLAPIAASREDLPKSIVIFH